MKKINVLYQVILFVCGICLFLFFPLVQGDRSTGAELLEDWGNYWDMLTSSFKIGLVLFNYASTVLLAGCILLKKKVGAILRLIGLAMPLWMVCIWFDSDMSVSVFFSFVLLSAAVVWAAIGVWRAFAQGEKKSAEKDRFGWGCGPQGTGCWLVGPDESRPRAGVCRACRHCVVFFRRTDVDILHQPRQSA